MRRVTPHARETAMCQRYVIVALLVMIASNIISLIIEPGTNAKIAYTFLHLIVVLPFVMVAVYRLAVVLGNSTGAAVFYCVLMLIPVVSVILLVVLNQKAMEILRRAGLKIGFFGVSDAELNRRG